ncbi:Ig-like domain-containing protein [Puerhibacterium puerhi]|uniref:Ig-like domain-containing protein n=1 Tax=Puerhibacterium puerhi TaxID=2692623 RepID=UPI001915C3C4|nr:Ig-like domain-containing protein [Puerhibacterium puerhi]
MLGEKRRAVASTTVVTVAATLVVAAVTYDGEATADVALNDSGVWVTKTSAGLLGRFNAEAQALDGTLLAGSSTFDVQQDAQRVLLTDPGTSSASPVDPAHLELGGTLRAPSGAQVASGGATTAVLDAKDGKLWVLPFASATSFDPEETEPVRAFEGAGALAVTRDGTVLAALPHEGVLVEVPTTANGVAEEPRERELDVAPGAEVEVTAVGDEAVVLDRSAGRLVLPGGDAVDLPDPGEARLQQPSAASDVVLVATTSGLVSQPLDGGDARVRPASGLPGAPVQLGGCSYGAWAQSGQVVRDCAGTDLDVDRTLEGLGTESRLEYRVNRDVIVLNDLSAGTVWLAAEEYQKVDDWDQQIPEDAEGEETESEETTPEQVDQVVADRTQPNRPPRPQDDAMGARPGRTTVLPVLANDVDPDGDVITAEVVEPPALEGVEVQRIMGGAALQAVVAEGVEGVATFRYAVSDGRGGVAEAQVTLTVAPTQQNSAPEQTGEPVLKIAKGGTASIDVLPYFLDPDGDDLVLASADATAAGDEVRSRPDGTVEMRDAGTSTGRKIVDLTVSDGLGLVAEGRLLVDVVAAPEPPIAVNDHVTVVAGQPVTVEPLRNDTDPNGDTLRLVGVADAAPAEITPNLDAGTFGFVSTEPGSYDVTYQVSDGPSATTGLVRVDVTEPPAQDEGVPVVVADQALLPTGGSTLVDVLANDTDPAGGVLVVQSVDVPADAGVSVAVLAHDVLRVTEVRRLDGPVTVRYTVSNGSRSATGEVRVVPVPAPDRLQPPDAAPDEVTVHAGDVVTIPVLRNDSHPDGLELSLAPELGETPDPTLGEAFVAEDVVRFKAGSQGGTAYLVYEVTDPNGQKDSAQVTVHVREGEENSAPRPPDAELRLLAGSAARVDLSLDGVDPDGDSVTLTGVATAPAKGTARIVDGFLEYQAGATSFGTDTFTYAVQDARGATATGTVRVGIARAADGNRPPDPVDDEVTVRPDRTVAVPALRNDSDPDGDLVSLVADGLEGAVELHGEVVDDRVVVTTPKADAVDAFYYTVEDPHGARAGAAITVTTSSDAPLLRPVARDDVVTLEQAYGNPTVSVDVLANDEDPDGTADALTVSVDDERVTVAEDGTLEVPVTDRRQIVTYTVTDRDGLEAHAFVHVPAVPGGNRPLPVIAPGPPLEVVAGEPLTLDLTEIVTVAEGREARITEERSVKGVEGRAEVTGPQQIVFTAPEDYAGPASVTFEATDGSGPDDPEGNVALLTQPITVLPVQNMPPEFVGATLQVSAGEEATLDLSRAATDPDGDDLVFAVDGAGSGITAAIEGSVLRVQAEASVPRGTAVPVTVSVRDGENPPVTGRVQAEVVASTRPLARANPDRVDDAHQGEPTTVPVLANDTNPFPETPLELVSAVVETGRADAPRISGDDVVVTPAADFVGVMVVRYRVQDATGDPDRQVEGRAQVTVLGRPEAPRAPQVQEVRSRTVVLTWDPPADNGTPITGYTVRTNDGHAQECATTTCTITGLTNDVTYTFTVTATNDVGESDPSPASEEARPDERPDPPAPPTLEFGDRSLTVTWTNRTYTDRSPIQCVNLEISPAPSSGAIQKTCLAGGSVTWTGLTNGVAYKVRAQAVNAAPEPSEWGDYSAEEVPAGVPVTPAAPTATRVSTALGGQVQVSWPAPDGNGDAPSAYRLEVLAGGGVARTLTVAGTSQTVQDLDPATTYAFRVSAQNKAGWSEVGPQSAAVVPYGKPAVPGGIAASLIDGDTSGKARVTWDAIAGSAFYGPGGFYEVRADGAGARQATSPYTYDGLSNGTAHSFQVRACNAYDCSDWSGASNAVTPYTTPGSPGVTWHQSGTNGGYFTVTRPNSDGGNAITSVQWQYSGSAGGNGTNGGFPFDVGVPAGYDRSYTLEARACNAAGCGPWGRANGNTAPKPQPSFTVGRGSPTFSGTCTDPSCASLTLTIRDAQPNAAFSYMCQASNGAIGTSRQTRMRDGTVARTDGNGNFGPLEAWCHYGYKGKEVWIETDIGTTNRMIW